MDKKRIVAGPSGGLLAAYGAYRFVMDVLGDVEIARSLLDSEAWLRAYGPVFIGLALLAWAIWPRGLSMSDRAEKPKAPDPLQNRSVAIWLENCDGGKVEDVKTSGFDHAVVSRNNRGTTISGVDAINAPNMRSPETDAPKEPLERRRKFFSGWRPDTHD